MIFNDGEQPEVVGVRLERQAPHTATTFPSTEPPASVTIVPSNPLGLLVVRGDHAAEELEVEATPLGDLHQCNRVLRETGATPTRTGVEERRTDAVIVTHAARHLAYVGARPRRKASRSRSRNVIFAARNAFDAYFDDLGADGGP